MDDAHRSPWIHSVTRGVFQPSISFHVAAVEKGPQRPKKWDGASFGFQASLASHGSGSFLTLPSPSRLFRNGLSDPAIPRGRYIPSRAFKRPAACRVREQISSLVRIAMGQKGCDTGCRRAGSGATFASRQGAVPKSVQPGSLRWCGETERLGAQERCRSPFPTREERVAPTHLAGCRLHTRGTYLSLARRLPVCQSASNLVCQPAHCGRGRHRRLLAWSAADMVRVGHPRRRRKVTAWRREVERSPRRAASRI